MTIYSSATVAERGKESTGGACTLIDGTGNGATCSLRKSDESLKVPNFFEEVKGINRRLAKPDNTPALRKSGRRRLAAAASQKPQPQCQEAS